MAEVTIVGAGIAGLTAALRLLQSGCRVEVIEQNAFVGGKWAAHQAGTSGDYHEHCYHMVLNWYYNLWDIVDELGIRKNFLPQHELHYLRRGDRLAASTALRDVGAPETALRNLIAGVMPIPDTFIYGYSLVDLLGRPFSRTSFLDQYSVNGFMTSRRYATDESARHHHRTLAKAFAAPSYATAASTYRNFIRYGFREPTPMMWMLNDNSDTAFFAPLLAKLRTFEGFTINFFHRVSGLCVENGRVAALTVEPIAASPAVVERPVEAAGPAKVVPVEDVVLAVPPGPLSQLVNAEVFAAAPELGTVNKLRSEAMASVDLYFRRSIPDMPEGVVILMDARYDLTFIDNSLVWPGYGHTFLNVVASDFDVLGRLFPITTGHDGRQSIDLEHPRSALDHILVELRRFVPFAPEDIDVDRVHIQTNVGEELVVNDVGSWQYRPDTACGIPNLFLAGDFVRTDVDAVTIEGAVTSGLLAAEAVRRRRRRGDPILIRAPGAYPEAAMAALAAAGLPLAYGAKLAAVAAEQAWLAYAEVMGDD